MNTRKKSKVMSSVLVYPDPSNAASGEDQPEPEVYPLNDDCSVIIGSDDTCGIYLDSDQVASKHTMLRMVDGVVFASDWFSDVGTLLNGRAIQDATEVGMMDQLAIGPYRLRIVVHSVYESWSAVESFDDEHDAVHSEAVNDAVVSDDASEDSQLTICADSKLEELSALLCEPEPEHTDLPESVESLSSSDTKLQEQLVAAKLQIEQLEKELEYQRSIQDMPESDEDNSNDEEKELLREEVLHLQTELAQREQELQEIATNGHQEVITEPAETAKLVERLEDLLDELQTADQRVLNLEEMLRASDEAYQSEVENHQQIEGWIAQLEQQVAARDDEWLAREQQLRKQLDESNERRKEAEARLTRLHSKKPNADEPAATEFQSQITELQSLNEELGTQLEESKSENTRLNQLIAKAGTNEAEIAQIGQLKQQLRESELELSEKRAELGRQKAELTKLRDEMDELASQMRPMEADNENLKLREFRKHLREIHEQDKQERQEKSLANRISRLWNRLDGR